jgi:hypothetical protein
MPEEEQKRYTKSRIARRYRSKDNQKIKRGIITHFRHNSRGEETTIDFSIQRFFHENKTTSSNHEYLSS